MSDCEWVDVEDSCDDEEWVVPCDEEIPEAYNPVPLPWSIYRTQLKLSISFVVLKDYIQTFRDPNNPNFARRLLST